MRALMSRRRRISAWLWNITARNTTGSLHTFFLDLPPEIRTTEEGLFDTELASLESSGLQFSHCIGFSSDGASSMISKENYSLWSSLQEESPMPSIFHAFATASPLLLSRFLQRFHQTPTTSWVRFLNGSRGLPSGERSCANFSRSWMEPRGGRACHRPSRRSSRCAGFVVERLFTTFPWTTPSFKLTSRLLSRQLIGRPGSTSGWSNGCSMMKLRGSVSTSWLQLSLNLKLLIDALFLSHDADPEKMCRDLNLHNISEEPHLQVTSLKMIHFQKCRFFAHKVNCAFVGQCTCLLDQLGVSIQNFSLSCRFTTELLQNVWSSNELQF